MKQLLTLKNLQSLWDRYSTAVLLVILITKLNPNTTRIRPVLLSTIS